MAEQVNEKIGGILSDQVIPRFTDIIPAKRIRAAWTYRPRLYAAHAMTSIGLVDLLQAADYPAVKQP